MVGRLRKRFRISCYCLAIGCLAVSLCAPLALAEGIDKTFTKPEAVDVLSWGELYSWATGREEFKEGKSYALVVGISKFTNGIPPLTYTSNDPIRMRDFLLNEAGFDHVHVLTEEKATLPRIRQLMEHDLPGLLTENDRFLFYWSGHGLDFWGAGRARGYLPLANSGPAERHTMISMDDLEDWDAFIEASHVLYLLDACASGLTAIERQGEEQFAELDNATLARLSKPGRHLITAGTGEQSTIAGPPWKGSVFTDTFLRAARGEADSAHSARGKDGVVSILELLGFVQDQVDVERREAGFEEAITPKMEKMRRDNQGGFFFITQQKKTETAEAGGGEATGEMRNGQPVLLETLGPGPASAGCDLETDRLLWESIKDETEAAYFEEYLRLAEAGEICGKFVQIAKLKLRVVPNPTPGPDNTEVSEPRRVKDAQELLTALGYDAGPADGVMGGRTRKALILFQDAQGLESTGRLTVDVEIAIAKAHAELGENDAAGTFEAADAPILPPLAFEPSQTLGPLTSFRDCEDCPEMMVIPSGAFWMGSRESEPGSRESEQPRHRVNVESFAIGKYEVTFDEWDACFDAGGCEHRPNDFGWGRGRLPVIDVSWEDAQQYVTWLSRETGQAYRLPSEAEWEYAARAFPTSQGQNAPAYAFGDRITEDQANFGRNVGQTTEVGSYPANAWDLHDMHGNVWEWVEDRWDDDYDARTRRLREEREREIRGQNPVTDENIFRVFRGGSWFNEPEILRSAIRGRLRPDVRNDVMGFRLARTLTP